MPIVTAAVTSITVCAGRGHRLEMRVEERRVGHAEVAQEAQRRPASRPPAPRLPVLAAFDQQRIARIVGVVEERVVAQPLAGRVAAVDDDVLGRAERLRELDALALPAGHRERRAAIGHRMQVEQVVDAIVERAQFARAGEIGGLPRAVQHLGGPQPVEVLVDAARRERIGGIERFVGGDVGEADRQRAARRPEFLGEQPVERDRAADLVAVRQRLQQDVRAGALRGECPDVGNAGVAGGPAGEIGKSDLDRRQRGASRQRRRGRRGAA